MTETDEAYIVLGIPFLPFRKKRASEINVASVKYVII